MGCFVLMQVIGEREMDQDCVCVCMHFSLALHLCMDYTSVSLSEDLGLHTAQSKSFEDFLMWLRGN